MQTVRPPIAASPTPEIIPPQSSLTPNPPATETPLPPATATAQAMQLFFPTADAPVGTQHRPPLYPIPWAISPYDHFYFARPISADYPGEPLWDFRYGGVYFQPDEVHTGIDIPAPLGTPVLAAAPGTVIWAGVGLYVGSYYYLQDPYGLAVAIRHDFGYHNKPLYTIYAHMSDIKVVVGQWVNTGDMVGYVGNTGFTTGPHLHFEVRLGANDFFMTRNPELWLVPAQGWGVLVGRVMYTRGTLFESYDIYVRNTETNQKWTVTTYGPNTINSDDYYHENLVLSDLPAGVYEVTVPFAGLDRKVLVQILPGQVTYFAFQGFQGYSFELPPPPESDQAVPTP